MSEEKPKCQLVGIDGNVFNIIVTVKRCLEQAGQREKAKEFQYKALSSKSYDDVLCLCLEYVDVDSGDDEEEDDDYFF